jgi:putative ABC transport system permease protein
MTSAAVEPGRDVPRLMPRPAEGRSRRAVYLPDLLLGLDNLRQHPLRSLLTMLGMIFGVAAVVSMLSIGAGAQQQVMALIEELGVRNLIVEAKEATDWQQQRKVRQTSPGLTFQDLRIMRSNVEGIVDSTARKRFNPGKMIPKPAREMPVVYGVSPSYAKIGGLRVAEGRFFDAEENDRASPVCVLGEGAKAGLFGEQDALGQYVKVNEQWFRVIGVVGPQLSAGSDMAGIPALDRNNLVYVPLYAAIFRLEDSYSEMRDEIDGIYLQLRTAEETVPTGEVVRGILGATHRQAADFSVVAPAQLLAEQRRTQRIFDAVMVAIASISLLVGGIGIMNIMLASIVERTREIGVRRAVGARRADIVRQFLIEAMLISFVGGVIGIVFGFGMSRLIALLAGWSTIVTLASIALAFLVSVSVGLGSGLYPALKAARLDPIAAIRYE